MGFTEPLRNWFFRGYLNQGEKILFVIHKHLFVELKNFFRVFFFGIFLPLVIFLIFPEIWFVAALWGAIGLFRFFYEFLDWYYDAWLVTNQSLIQVLWDGFFKKSSNRIEYHTIEGAGHEVKGMSRTLFNYGTIVVEKFTGNQLIFDGAVSPRKKVEKLLAFHEKFITQKNFRDHRTLRGILNDMIHHHLTKETLVEESEEAE